MKKRNVLDILKERGFVKQVVYEDELYKKLGEESVTFYIGYDPTADSMHVGHFVTLMAMAHMQQAGHRPIALLGGGTGMVGDPSGRTDMRMVMTKEVIASHIAAFRKQMEKFIDFSGGKALMFDNADWLLNLNYVEFLRDIGVHFSVNKMLTAECFKQRLEKGLSFFEFNYMLMQSYDFLVLFKNHSCCLQLGGDDQWSNILAGADLIRRKEGKPAYAMTFALLTTSQGGKMGKTAQGAVWLDSDKTPPYDFYQYWRNVDDGDVEKCLKLLTFLPIDEIHSLCKVKGEQLNEAKKRLAFEITKIIHGEKTAEEVKQQVEAAFSGDTEHMPTMTISKAITNYSDILVACQQAKSRGEARRLIEGGGIKINETAVTDPNGELTKEMLKEKTFVLHRGKKVHIKVDLV